MAESNKNGGDKHLQGKQSPRKRRLGAMATKSTGSQKGSSGAAGKGSSSGGSVTLLQALRVPTGANSLTLEPLFTSGTTTPLGDTGLSMNMASDWTVNIHFAMGFSGCR